MQNRGLFSIDTLHFFVKTEGFKCAESFLRVGDLEIERTNLQTRLFKEHYYVKKNDLHYFDFFANARNSYLDENLGKIEVKNMWLYTDFVEELINDLQLLGLKFNNLSRLDVAFDSNCDLISKLNEFLKSEDQIRANHRIQFNAIRLDKDKNFTKFEVGSLKSDCYFVIYDKSNELKRSNKSYIKRFFRENNLNGKITRCEGRFNSRFFHKLEKDISLELLKDKSFLISIFISKFKKMFDFRLKSLTNLNVSRLIKVELINFCSYDFNSKFLKLKRRIGVGLYNAKRLVKSIYLEKIIAEGEQKSQFSLVLSFILQKFGLEYWFDEKKYFWNVKLEGI